MTADWKSLKRHPLSCEYRDITGPAWMRFCLKMKHGFLAGFPIMLHDGMVLDGWQRLRACIETNTEPIFTTFPGDIDAWLAAKEYVEMVNDERRHETPEERTARIEARLQRTADARRVGKSLRTIAEEEGVSESQTRRDIGKKSTTAPGGAVDPPNGKVVGKDGVERPAKRPKIRCAKCIRIWPNTDTAVKDCPQCATAQAESKENKTKTTREEPTMSTPKPAKANSRAGTHHNGQPRITPKITDTDRIDRLQDRGVSAITFTDGEIMIVGSDGLRATIDELVLIVTS